MEIVKPKKSFDLEILITSVKFMSVEADTIEEARELALQQSRKHFYEDFRGVDIVEAPKIMKFEPGIYEDLDYPTYASILAWRSHDLTTLLSARTRKHQREMKESPALLRGACSTPCSWSTTNFLMSLQ